MKVAFHDYAGKGARLAGALQAAGHELVADHGDVAVVDLDHPDTGLPLCETHDKVVTYPHGGNPILWWDDNPPHPHIRLHLVHGPGHSAVFALHGHPVPSLPVGFTYCDVAEPWLRADAGPTRVLFAPCHPMDDGTLDPFLRAANSEAAKKLADSGKEITVSMWGEHDWGFDPFQFRTIVGGTLDTSYIDDADLVVADGTFAALAIARKVPTLFVGSDINLGHPHWSRYAPFVRYPYDIADGPLGELYAAVNRRNILVKWWAHDFVGGPFNAALAVAAIEAVAEQ